MAYDREVADANKDYNKDNEIVLDHFNDRDDAIKAQYAREIDNEETHHESTLALILEDHRICMERVINY